MDDDPDEVLGGVTWSGLGEIIWITVAILGGVVVTTMLWDVLVSHHERKYRHESLRMALIKPAEEPPWRLKLARILNPVRSRSGRLIEMAYMLISIFQLFQYFVRSYSQSSTEITVLATVTASVFNTFFIIRYLLKLIAHEPGSRLKYVTSFIAILDVVTIVSALLPEIGAVATFLTFTYFRAVIIVHSYSNLDFWLTPPSLCNRISAQLIRIGLSVLAFLIVMACTVMTLERAGDPDSFGNLVQNSNSYTLWNSIYWALVTLTTVGYGDITPTTALGRLATCLFLTAGVVIASSLFSIILDLARLRRRGMSAFSNLRKKMTIIVTGETHRSQLIDVLGELFPPGQSDVQQHLHVVALLDHGIFNDEDRDFFVAHPYYRTIFTYLQGTVFSWSDLVRSGATAPEAHAIMILSGGNSQNDDTNILRLLAIRRLVPTVSTFVMLRHSKNLEYALAAGIPQSNIILTANMRYGLLSMNMICPGSAALLLNALSSSMSNQSVSAAIRSAETSRASSFADKKNRQKSIRTRRRRGRLERLDAPSVADIGRTQTETTWRTVLTSCSRFLLHACQKEDAFDEDNDLTPCGDNKPSMEREYGSGINQMLHQFRCPPWLIGQTPFQAAVTLFLIRMAWCGKTYTELCRDIHHDPSHLDELFSANHLMGDTQAPILLAVEMGKRKKPPKELDLSSAESKNQHKQPTMLFDMDSDYKLQAGDSLFVLVGNMDHVPTASEMEGFLLLVTTVTKVFRNKSNKTTSTQSVRRPRHSSVSGSREADADDDQVARSTSLRMEQHPDASKRWHRLQTVSTTLQAFDRTTPLPIARAKASVPDIASTGRGAHRVPKRLHKLSGALPRHRQTASEQLQLASFRSDEEAQQSDDSSSNGASCRSQELEFEAVEYQPANYSDHVLILCHSSFEEIKRSFLPILYSYGIRLVVALVADDLEQMALLARPVGNVENCVPMRIIVLAGDPTDPKLFVRAGASKASRLIVLSEGIQSSETGDVVPVNLFGGSAAVTDLRARDIDALTSLAANHLDSIRLDDALVDAKSVMSTLLAEHHLLHTGGNALAGTVTELSNPSSILFLSYNFLRQADMRRSRFRRPSSGPKITVEHAEASNAGDTESKQGAAEDLGEDTATDLGDDDSFDLTSDESSAYERWRVRFGLRWSLRYSAGRLIPIAAMDTFLCHAFYNPSSLHVVQALLHGTCVQMRHCRIPTDILEEACVAYPPKAEGGTSCFICPYWYLFMNMLVKYQVITMGLFRHRKWLQAALPYVQTNPMLSAPVRTGDLLFVLVPQGRRKHPLKDFLV